MRYKQIAFLGGLLLALPGAVLAADGATPIWQPTIITQPGKYVLTRNLTVLDGTPITITASNVDLDLNGFSVTAYYQAIVAQNVRGVTVHDGSVEQAEDAILFLNVNDFAIRRVVVRTMDGVGLYVTGSNGIVEDNLVFGFSGQAIGASGSFITVRNNQVREGEGVNVNCDGCHVVGNEIIGGHLVISGSGNSVTDNVVRALYGNDGIAVWGADNHFERNVATGSSGFGLHFFPSSSGNVYRGNMARGNNGSATGCSAANADFCDEGTGNTSHEDNYLPNRQ